MTKKIYIKDTSFDPIYREVSKGFFAKTRVIPSLLFFSGLFVLTTQVILPLIIFKTNDKNVDLIDNATVLGRAAGFYSFKFDELEKRDDGIDFKNNFDGGNTSFIASGDDSQNSNVVLGDTVANVPEFYYLSVPKLKINKAIVETSPATLDPADALGHYNGTEFPGEVGNSFVYGHSVLPWFFNQKNYKTIFSTLGKLETGDEFFVNYNNKGYRYIVESKEELSPNNVNPLNEIKPRYLNESTMTLMTCSPPGTKLKRLMVYGVLQNN